MAFYSDSNGLALSSSDEEYFDGRLGFVRGYYLTSSIPDMASVFEKSVM